VNAPPGRHTYAVVAYKSRLVVSVRSSEVDVVVPPDTRSPQRVPALLLSEAPQGVELRWPMSASRDVVRYRVVFTGPGAAPREVETVEAKPGAREYVFLHRERLSPGRYRYAVVAEDEAGNVSAPAEASLAILDRPAPNPFTPLGRAPFDRVVFPTRAIPDAEGDLIVRLFDLHGRLVRELRSPAGDIAWDGRSENDTLLPGGIYVYQMEIGGQFRVGTVVMIR
jgi:hypothetical protein